MSRPHASLRLVFGVTFAAFAAVLVVAPAVAASASPSAAPSTPVPTPSSTSSRPPSPASTPASAALVPLVDCIQDAPLGAVSSRTVVLGYRSTDSAPLTMPAGAGANDLTAGAAGRGQPTEFQPGEHHGVWLLTVDAAAEPDLAWRLGTTQVPFDSAPACTAATTVTVSAPAPVAAGGVVSLSATVARMLLAAPGTGTVAFALDGGTPVGASLSPTGVALADLPVPTAGPHTVTATYRPADGSALLSSVGTVAFDAAAASSPLSVSADSVVAGSTDVSVAITRPTAVGAATVDVMTADGTAHAGPDYTALTTTVTLADGQASATVRIPLASRPPGSPAATFFVLLQRASTAVTAASATVALPAVPPAPAAAAAGGDTHAGAGGAVSSALPPDDPTAVSPAAATARAGQDLAMMLGGVLLTGGGILGAVGLVRAAGVREARA
ncbi:Calx-beta domain-containing protein [Leifsonia sp. fls2-241-R2A-40a]|uniref:Ig-like domain repeat protein n=1 Tax=Leifsonia sp. fls2-241-R2A-40a TaxID=3040290 RepID=UPI00254A2978|nr:Calx-beta domain-containing protein [Leifsonia sp. fls2-241-R2A-40a]